MEEFAAAESLEAKFPEQAAYMLQQSLEKLLRGLLEMKDIPCGPTHNLQALASLMDDTTGLADRFKALDELSVAATRYRYPGPQGNLRKIDRTRLAFLMKETAKLNAEVGAILGAFIQR